MLWSAGVLSSVSGVAWAAERQPSVLHGVGQVLAGLLVEFPKTVLAATFDGPPVVGTLVGVLAGASRAVQVTVEGMVEIVRGFDPWQTTRRASGRR
jgi:hypothetical protein